MNSYSFFPLANYVGFSEIRHQRIRQLEQKYERKQQITCIYKIDYLNIKID